MRRPAPQSCSACYADGWAGVENGASAGRRVAGTDHQSTYRYGGGCVVAAFPGVMDGGTAAASTTSRKHDASIDTKH
jgi:hypothetical protein